MKDYIQRRIGLAVALCAFIIALINFFLLYDVSGHKFFSTLLEVPILFVLLSGLLILFTAFIKSNIARLIQVSVAFLTSITSSLTTTSGDLTYLVFFGVGFALAMEYGFLDRRFVLKSFVLVGIQLLALIYGMVVINNLNALNIIHTLLGTAVVVYIFAVLLRVRAIKQAKRTEYLEEQVALRTRDLREEMERVKQLKEDLQGSLEEKNHLLMEKDILLREVLHRTKNNMQLVSSLLSLEKDNMENSPAAATLEKSMSRIRTLALAHENLYRSESLTKINLKTYLERMITDLWSDIFRSNIKMETDIPRDIPSELDFAIHLGLILNELLNNAYSHAFPEDRDGEIYIRVILEPEKLQIVFRDNGIGMPDAVVPEKTETLGFRLVLDLLEHYDGTYTLHRETGTEWILSIPFHTEDKPPQG